MRFTRQNKSVRVWFQAVRNTGQLRTGLTNGDFTITVINSADSAVINPTVTESVQRPGNYYCDITSSFFLTNGPGDYNISIEIDSINGPSGNPNIRTAMSDVLQVTREDFDSLSGSIWNTTASLFNSPGSMGALMVTASNAGSTTVIVGDIVSGVWDAQASTFNTTGTMGYMQNLMDEVSSSVAFIKEIENGTWHIVGSQMIFYASGTSIEIARFNLQDISGIAIDPSTQNPFRRSRV